MTRYDLPPEIGQAIVGRPDGRFTIEAVDNSEAGNGVVNEYLLPGGYKLLAPEGLRPTIPDEPGLGPKRINGVTAVHVAGHNDGRNWCVPILAGTGKPIWGTWAETWAKIGAPGAKIEQLVPAFGLGWGVPIDVGDLRVERSPLSGFAARVYLGEHSRDLPPIGAEQLGATLIGLAREHGR
jgi:hypothetical protein